VLELHGSCTDDPRHKRILSYRDILLEHSGTRASRARASERSFTAGPVDPALTRTDIGFMVAGDGGAGKTG
jgi:hypothetical protein